MIVAQVVPDRFSQVAEDARRQAISGSSEQQGKHVRRMTRGIVVKDDTFATLRVVAGNNKPINIVDAGSRRMDKDNQPLVIGDKRATDIYSNFLIQQVQEERVEKQQIVETFGEPYIFLFGERARVISFTGILANTFDFNWEAEWWHNYENYLRGTKCVENDARIFLSFDTTLVGGYIIASSASKMSQERNWVQFQFQLFVTSYANFSDVGNASASQGFTDPRLLDGELSEAEARVYRPNVVDDRGAGNPPPGTRVEGGRVVPPNLLDQTAQSLIESVSEVWNTTSRVVDGVLARISQAANGSLVRVPVGFEGSLAFDEEADVHVREVKYGGKVRFTTFSDNLDEYVGESDHYGSSAIGLVGDLGERSFVGSPTDAEALTKVRKVWTDAGLEIPGPQLGPLTSFLARKSIGLIGLGASRAWVFAGQGELGDAVKIGSAALTIGVSALPE